jgi:hypothetical protein
MFKIIYHIDEKDFIEISKGFLKTLNVYNKFVIKIGDIYYPHFTWKDFSILTISGWLSELKMHANKKKIVLSFMDDAYEIELRKTNDKECCLKIYHSGTGKILLENINVDFEDVLQEVRSVGMQMLGRIEKYNDLIKTEDYFFLREGLKSAK